MKHIITICVFLLLCSGITISGIARNGKYPLVKKFNKVTKTWDTFPQISIHDMQFVPMDSLLKADTIQTANQGRNWTLQTSRFMGDTVDVTGLVVVPTSYFPPHAGITFTSAGFNFLLHDTSTNSNEWTGVFARIDPLDSVLAMSEGFTDIQRGDIVDMVVLVNEFPTDSINSTTEPQPLPAYGYSTLSRGNSIPAPTLINASDLYQGSYPGGKIHFSTGEKYEGGLVQLRNMSVTGIVNSSRGQFQMTDSSGNYVFDYDLSHYFTVAHLIGSQTWKGDTAFTNHQPQAGMTITMIQGTISTSSGGNTNMGYRICPLYPGDVVYGISKPVVTSHKRVPVIVGPVDTVAVQAVAKQIAGGFPITNVSVAVSANYGPWRYVPMNKISGDTTYQAFIWNPDDGNNPYPIGTNIRYFVKAIDDHGYSTLLANSSGRNGFDSSKGLFQYSVTGQYVTIHDVQYTPYTNGLSLYGGAPVTVRGIVTADSTNIGVTSYAGTNGGTTAWYIENNPGGRWQGIWVVKDSVIRPPLDTLRLGDSVAVSGNIVNLFDVTAISDTAFTVISHHNHVPDPVTVTTSVFANRNVGDTVAGGYLSVLMRVVNAHLAKAAPVTSDLTEYTIDDGTGEMDVRRDGLNKYSNQPQDTSIGKTILYPGDRFDTLIGIGYYSYNVYKIVPRNNSDFVVYGDTNTYNAKWNMISVPRYQAPDSLYYRGYLYPEATTSAYAYSNGYTPVDTIRPGVGYWLKYNNPVKSNVFGQRISNDTISVAAGWNMVGAPGTPLATSSVRALPSGNHIGTFWKYYRGYVAAPTLEPGLGYWVKSDSTGSIIQKTSTMLPLASSASNPSTWNSVTLSDSKGSSQTLYFTYDENGKTIRLRDYEMPPPPFANELDVRYASGRGLETYGSIDPRTVKTFPIQLRNGSGAITLTWNIIDRTGNTFSISDEQNGKILANTEMKGTGTVKNIKITTGRLLLKVGGNPTIPLTYYLAQNYPNPFNPSTKFEFGLPVASHMEIVVYNVLGQKVNTLVNEDRSAGLHTIVWNGVSQFGNQVSSGVYFVRMVAGKFSQVRKIMLIK
ncbi:MAG: T9SS type A sorting domain-containing protein [Bacteroidota bacterium]